MRIVYLGSGAFGLPTLRALSRAHDVVQVVSQPARPAGRSRKVTPTPAAEYAAKKGIDVFTPDDPNDPAAMAFIHALKADAYVIIAYGHKLSEQLLGDTFACNLHASLLPKYRGAAPINRAVMAGERESGVSVITIAQRMDAGDILVRRSLRIGRTETAGELHDRFAELGPEAMLEVLEHYAAGTLEPAQQDESLATRAPRLSKQDGTVQFDQPADDARAWINGLNPWPGCTVLAGDQRLKILRADSSPSKRDDADEPGTILDDHSLACLRGTGALRLLSVQPAGGKSMTFEAFCRGRNIGPGDRMKTMEWKS